MDIDPLSINLLLVNLPGHAIDSEISIWKLLLTIFLVFLNGFFVAAEFAIVKVRSSQIDVNQDVNPGIAKTAKTIVTHLDSYLAATQLGITLASLGLGWVGESSLTPVIIKFFEVVGLTDAYWTDLASKISFPIAFAIITVLHIVFGELAPKSLAIRYPTNTTFAIAWPLRIFYIIGRPIIWTMNGLANLILRMIGIKPIHGSEIHTEEELKMIITESQEGGAIEESERDLIQNVFDFDDRRVSNIQTLRKNVSAVDITLSVKEALEFCINEGYSRYPVFEDSLDNIKGILYTRDLVKLTLEKPNQTNFGNIMRRPFFVSENAKIKNLLKQFQNKHIQLAIVTNEIGEMSGIVSMEDILEELVGEIQDEYDDEAPIVEVIDDKFVINAHNNLNDINRFLPYKIEESELYETFAGYLAEMYPDKEFRIGDEIEIPNYVVKIMKMYRNSVEQLEATLIDKEDENGNSSES